MKKPKPARPTPAARADGEILPRLTKRVETLTAELNAINDINRRFARDKARRTDQFKALLQVANILLAVASNEIVRLDRDYVD